MDKPEKVELGRMTVAKLAELCVKMIRSGNEKAVVTLRVNGKSYELGKLLVHRLPLELILESVEDLRIEDDPTSPSGASA